MRKGGVYTQVYGPKELSMMRGAHAQRSRIHVRHQLQDASAAPGPSGLASKHVEALDSTRLATQVATTLGSHALRAPEGTQVLTSSDVGDSVRSSLRAHAQSFGHLRKNTLRANAAGVRARQKAHRPKAWAARGGAHRHSATWPRSTTCTRAAGWTVQALAGSLTPLQRSTWERVQVLRAGLETTRAPQYMAG